MIVIIFIRNVNLKWFPCKNKGYIFLNDRGRSRFLLYLLLGKRNKLCSWISNNFFSFFVLYNGNGSIRVQSSSTNFRIGKRNFRMKLIIILWIIILSFLAFTIFEISIWKRFPRTKLPFPAGSNRGKHRIRGKFGIYRRVKIKSWKSLAGIGSRGNSRSCRASARRNVPRS